MLSPEVPSISRLLRKTERSVADTHESYRDIEDPSHLPSAFSVVGDWLPALISALQKARSTLRAKRTDSPQEKARYPQMEVSTKGCLQLAERLGDIYDAVSAYDNGSQLQHYHKGVKNEDDTVEGVMKKMLQIVLAELKPLVDHEEVESMKQALNAVSRVSPSLDDRHNAGHTFNNHGSGVLLVNLGERGRQNVNTGTAPQFNGDTPNAHFYFGGSYDREHNGSAHRGK